MPTVAAPVPMLDEMARTAAVVIAIAGGLATITGAVIGWVKLLSARGEKRVEAERAIAAALEKKVDRIELDAVRDRLDSRLSVVSEQNRAENLDLLKQVCGLDKTVLALHARADRQDDAIKENTKVTLATQATADATRDMVRTILDRLEGREVVVVKEPPC